MIVDFKKLDNSPIWVFKGGYNHCNFTNVHHIPYIAFLKPGYCLAVRRSKQKLLKPLGL